MVSNSQGRLSAILFARFLAVGRNKNAAGISAVIGNRGSANQPRDLSRRVGRISFHWMAQFQNGRLSASCASRLRFEDHIQETVAVTQTQTRMRKETVNTTMNGCENCLPQESIFRIATNSAGLRSPPPRQLLQNRRTDFLPFP